jgi:hypothetical protein
MAFGFHGSLPAGAFAETTAEDIGDGPRLREQGAGSGFGHTAILGKSIESPRLCRGTIYINFLIASHPPAGTATFISAMPHRAAPWQAKMRSPFVNEEERLFWR